jgi:hypothetical protein
MARNGYEMFCSDVRKLLGINEKKIAGCENRQLARVGLLALTQGRLRVKCKT